MLVPSEAATKKAPLTRWGWLLTTIARRGASAAICSASRQPVVASCMRDLVRPGGAVPEQLLVSDNLAHGGGLERKRDHLDLPLVALQRRAWLGVSLPDVCQCDRSSERGGCDRRCDLPDNTITSAERRPGAEMSPFS